MAAPQNMVSVSRRPPDVEDYIDILRRYRSWVIGPTFAGLVISMVVAFWLPDQFACTAAMQIKPGSVSRDLMPSAMTGQMATRLQQLRLEILGRDNLILLINKLDLYKKEKARYPVEDVAEEYFRKHVRIDLYGEGDSRGAQAFRIWFEYPDRAKARLVVQELVAEFQNRNVVLQSTNANTATTLWDDLVKTAKEKMEAAQNALASFISENQGRLPDNFIPNMLEVQSKSAQIANENELIAQEKQKQALLESDWNNNKNMQSQVQANLEQTVTTQTSQTANQNLINTEQLIANKKIELEGLLRKYRPDFPDVLVAQDAIRMLEERRDAFAKEESGAPRPSGTVRTVQNPQVAQQLANLVNEENNIKAKISASVLAAESHQRQVAEMTRQLREVQDKVTASPQVIQRFNQLSQDVAMARQEYEEKSKGKDTTASQEKMEEHQAGERLDILELPNAPDTPTSPIRPAIVSIGTVMGLVLGISLAGAKEIKNTSLKNLKDVRAYTNLPVLSSIPLLENALLVRRKRRLAWLAWSSALIIGSILMCSAVYYHLYLAQPVS
jgi:succinoglycan biosynthesis transport protein ExoP